ncbi:rhomboid family intramembrane serine protease [Psychrobacter sp. YP14]|jgi:membrane associated rhomboid family serine protease|uniref:Rhomboid family intramembrane serine protease n=3 Tax=Psychrobacter TaxID=497 RepID=A0A844M0E1_9GAMM|nr:MULTISPECIES: rhomboid family intramembrane serine protease [Psychrobacter]AWT49423.1 rhomboid family intramembrane serine protease [Psychrobacter sp. YP14]MUG32215.1 rhomboid family intramembrane serine protease [Psychrobacter sanguinis]
MTIKTLFSRAPVTALLLISFVGLFVIQVASGVDINEPSLPSLLKWGANALPYTVGYEPWRLISSAFLHIGLMHLLFNCFAMYYFGQAAEVSFGSIKFLLLFLLSAVGGNLLNSYVTWWQIFYNNGAPGISAGASGGIMGIGMALLMVELLKKSLLKFPSHGKNPQLRSLALIMGINLMYGFAVPGIDNAGHIGGALTGAVLAVGIMVGYRYSILGDKPLFKALPWLIFAIITIIFYQLWLDLHLQIGL